MNPDLSSIVDDKLSPVFSSLLTQNNILLMCAIFAIMTGLKAGFADLLATRTGQRVQPILPLVLGLVGAFTGCSDALTRPDKAMIGLLAGFIASHLSTIGRTTLLGRGLAALEGEVADVPAAPVVPVPPAAPAPTSPVAPVSK